MRRSAPQRMSQLECIVSQTFDLNESWLRYARYAFADLASLLAQGA